MIIYISNGDYQRFIKKLDLYSEKYRISILNYCLMPNHFHFMINVEEKDCTSDILKKSKSQRISSFMRDLQNAYAKYFNLKYTHSGHVFQGAYRLKPVLDDSYLEALIIYINNNPVRKGLVKKAEEWPYSCLSIDLANNG